MAAPAAEQPAAARAPAASRRLLTGAEALLAGAVAAVTAWEWLLWTGPFAAGQSTAPAWWYAPPAAVMLAALLAAWPRRAALRPGAVVALSALLCLAFLAVHAAAGGPRDQDITRVYAGFGAQLRAGRLPAAEYPPLAVVVFAAAGALGPLPVTLPLLLLPALLASWWALARLGPDGAWAAACAALWPTLVPFWEVKFDALPTALCLGGLVAAHRRAWGWAGALLAVGAGVKWYPGVAVPVLAVALLRRGDRPGLRRLLGGAAGGLAVCTLPFAGQPQALAFPYRFHAARGITAESLPYLVLRLLGLADRPARAWFEAAVPAWAPAAAAAALVAVLAGVVVVAWRRPDAAVGLGAAAVAAFLMANRVFSPQFLLPLAALWALGVALHGGAARRGPAVAVLLAAAATSNWAVWPVASPGYVALGWLLFAAALAASVLAFAPPTRALR